MTSTPFLYCGLNAARNTLKPKRWFLPLTLLVWRTRNEDCTRLRARSLQPCPRLCDPMDHSLPGFSRQECWSGVLFPSPGDLPGPGIAGLFRLPPRRAGCSPLAPPGKPRGLQGEANQSARTSSGRCASRLCPPGGPAPAATALCHAGCLLRLAFLVSMLWFTSHVHLLMSFSAVLGLVRCAGSSWFAASPQPSPRSGSPGRRAPALGQRLGSGGAGI